MASSQLRGGGRGAAGTGEGEGEGREREARRQQVNTARRGARGDRCTGRHGQLCACGGPPCQVPKPQKGRKHLDRQEGKARGTNDWLLVEYCSGEGEVGAHTKTSHVPLTPCRQGKKCAGMTSLPRTYASPLPPPPDHDCASASPFPSAPAPSTSYWPCSP